jgi:hypothetical protein
MSRGLGYIERIIASEVETAKATDTPVCETPWELACRCFSEPEWEWRPTIGQRKAVRRALHSFVRKFPQYALMGGRGRKSLFLYDTADADSVAWATAQVNNRMPVPLCRVAPHRVA